MRRVWCGLVAVWVGALLLCGSPAWAQVAPPLGVAQQFGTLGNSGVTGAAGGGVVVNGDVGSSPTPAVTNFPPSIAVPPFIVHPTNDAVVQQARVGAIAAYNAMTAQGAGTVLPDNLASVGALVPGIYSFASGAPDLPAGATLTLNGNGIFIFNVGSSLTANALSNVTGSADPCNIYWRVGSSATLNGSNFRGTVVANASITLGAGANLAGRALAGTGATGAVTMAGSGGNTIGGCSVPQAPVCPAITLTPSTLPNGTVGVPYSQTITGNGGTAPYTFTVTSGTLPAGLTLTTTGVLVGTPTAPGSSAVTIRGTDANGCFASITVTIVIAAQPPGCPPVSIVPATLPNGTVGVAYNQTLSLSGGTAPVTFAVIGGTLPAGMTLTPQGVIAGTPTTAASSTVTIQATDANGCLATITVTIVISAPQPPGCPPVAILPGTLPNATLGVAYSQTLTLTGGAPPATFAVISGTLPTGLTLGASGQLSGTPTTAGSFTATIRGVDANGCFAEVPIALVVVTPVPTMPQLVAALLALGLLALGYLQLRSRARHA